MYEDGKKKDYSVYAVVLERVCKFTLSKVLLTHFFVRKLTSSFALWFTKIHCAGLLPWHLPFMLLRMLCVQLNILSKF